MNTRFYLVLCGLTLLNSCLVMGQDSIKRQITEADYAKWGDLNVNSISDNGDWCSYTMTYENGMDTLYVQSTDKKKTYSFPKGREGKFVNNGVFAYRAADTLKVVNLENQKVFVLAGVKRFEALAKGKLVLTYTSDSSLEIRRIDGSKVNAIGNVTAYKTNEVGNGLVYMKNKGTAEVGYINLNNGEHKVLISGANTYGRFSWQANGNSVVFGNENEIYLYRLKEDRLLKFDIKTIAGYEGAVMAKGGFTNLTVSDDGAKVFFSIINPLVGLSKSSLQEVEIWNGNDNCLFPTRQLIASADTPKLMVWFPDNGAYKVLSDNSRFNVCLASNGGYVLLSDPYTYTLESHYPKRVDYYLKNVNTGAEKLLLEQYPEDRYQLSFSPFGNAMVYYRDKKWWFYNLDTDVETLITKSTKQMWDTADRDDPAYSGAYGIAAWTADGKHVLLYDRYDIWKAALDGSACTRLTTGREKWVEYRISKTEFEAIRIRGYEGKRGNVVDLKNDIVLEVENTLDWSTGYTLYNTKNGFRELVYGQKNYSNIKKSANGKYLFTSETFSQPLQVEFSDKEHRKTLFQSNSHQKAFDYGRSDLVKYKNSRGEELNGALFYPANYKAGEKYPMIVKIYERLSGTLNEYVKPTLANNTGFNTTVLTSKGYFVLMPDIKYIKGETGISAYDCVTTAVKEVVATYDIDANRIGLIGHSFGGYETDFIITKTNMFAAAVSGAGIGNTIGHYFGLNRNGGGAEDGMWRYENQQQRMGTPFYENRLAYLDNSPLYNAGTIRTPLLQWAGKNDVVVPYEQSINFYLALRKLRVKNIMLAYPDEGHSLKKEVNQRDLTSRVLQWFDYYLKGKTDVGWISVGTTEE